jgi:hypothetical protein
VKDVNMWTYLVGWDDDLIIKAGVTMGRRWKKFVSRGATLYLLHRNDSGDGRTFCDLERVIYAGLPPGMTGRAFSTKEEAVGHLGSGGGGYMECVRAVDERAYRDAVASCERIMRSHPVGLCGNDMRALMHGRTDERTYVEGEDVAILLTAVDVHARIKDSTRGIG